MEKIIVDVLYVSVGNGGVIYVKDVSAEKKAEAKGAWFQEKNEYFKWKKSIKES